jgi:hypothetical protein
MGITIGPVDWWLASPQSYSGLISGCPAGTQLLDGSRIICKAGGTAWIIAPNCTQVGSSWNNSTNTQVGNKCCVCDWPTLCSRLISCGFNPGDWFVPSVAQLQNPGYLCRTQWDTFTTSNYYWSSTETGATLGCDFLFGNNCPGCLSKSGSYCVRAMRCVTY